MNPSSISLSRGNLIAASSLDLDDEISRKKYSRSFMFHTKLEPTPYAVFDIGYVAYARRLQIRNRASNAEIAARARTLKLSISTDLIAWTPCVLTSEGDLSSFFSDIDQNMRFLHLSLDDYGPLHLCSILVEGVAHQHPSCRFASHGEYGFVANGSYCPNHNAGFFSVASVTLLDIMRHPHVIERIDGRFALNDYKDQIPSDIWCELFSPPDESIPVVGGDDNYFTKRLVQHDRYENMDLTYVLPFVRRYFRPSTRVTRRIEAIREKYRFDPSKTLVLYYRGTDKHTEVKPTPIDDYIAKAEEIINEKPWLRLMVQTDQSQVKQLVLSHFGDRAFAVEELPVTESSTVVHRLLKENKVDFAANFLATTALMSQCDEVITGTGNVSFWTVLYRGSTLRVHQF